MGDYFQYRGVTPADLLCFLATAGRNLLSCLDLGDRTGPTDRPDRPTGHKQNPANFACLASPFLNTDVVFMYISF